jgi:hypothetical protein
MMRLNKMQLVKVAVLLGGATSRMSRSAITHNPLSHTIPLAREKHGLQPIASRTKLISAEQVTQQTKRLSSLKDERIKTDR